MKIAPFDSLVWGSLRLAPMKIPPFDPLVWGSLRLAPINARATTSAFYFTTAILSYKVSFLLLSILRGGIRRSSDKGDKFIRSYYRYGWADYAQFFAIMLFQYAENCTNYA